MASSEDGALHEGDGTGSASENNGNAGTRQETLVNSRVLLYTRLPMDGGRRPLMAAELGCSAACEDHGKRDRYCVACFIWFLVKRLWLMFRLLDDDETGKISSKNLKLISDVGDDGGGTTGWGVSFKMLTHKILNRDPKDEILKAFRLLVDDETGKISFKNLVEEDDEHSLGVREDEVTPTHAVFGPFINARLRNTCAGWVPVMLIILHSNWDSVTKSCLHLINTEAFIVRAAPG